MTYPVEHQKLAGWANYPIVEAEVATPPDREAVRDYILKQERLIARGNGKSYGDASLAPHVLSTLALRQITHFDPVTGIIECEAGVLLSDILVLIVPKGWFFYVTPGIKSITVGGAIASDVHGKNHPSHGCFSHHLISFELMTASGAVIRCSKESNADLFWQSCGGMGWTGVILSARFQLRPIRSTQMQQNTVWASNWEHLFAALSGHPDYEYAAAWVDGLSKGQHFGRGAAFFANHAEGQGSAALEFREKKPRNVRFYAPSGLLNPWSIKIHNALYLRKKPPGEQTVDLDTYFYPLDGVQNWNRLYGRRGFVQYQFCLPVETAFDGIAKALQTIQQSPDAPFLTVLKRHGARPPEAKYSFPIQGYSLALDFPRTRTVFALVRQLDELVWNAGGKIYLTKDACSAGKMGRVEVGDFGEGKWWSALRGRIFESEILLNKKTKMLETKRLILRPLTYEQLVKYIKCDNSLEIELDLNKTSRTISPELKEAFEQTILPNVADKTKNYLYSTLWTAISKTENKMIGDLCIVGEPNAAGEIEIGYGTYEEFQNKGFMTEMVSAIIEWATTQPIVQSIIASTDKTNTASFKVLEKNHFIKIGETDTLFNWKLDIRNK